MEWRPRARRATTLKRSPELGTQRRLGHRHRGVGRQGRQGAGRLCPEDPRRAQAADNPAGPEPTTAIFLPVSGATVILDRHLPESRSATNLFNALMAIGAFISLLRHASSHG